MYSSGERIETTTIRTNCFLTNTIFGDNILRKEQVYAMKGSTFSPAWLKICLYVFFCLQFYTETGVLGIIPIDSLPKNSLPIEISYLCDDSNQHQWFRYTEPLQKYHEHKNLNLLGPIHNEPNIDFKVIIHPNKSKSNVRKITKCFRAVS